MLELALTYAQIGSYTVIGLCAIGLVSGTLRKADASMLVWAYFAWPVAVVAIAVGAFQGRSR